MGVKISELPAASALAGTEPLPLVQAAETRKATVSDIAPVRSVAGKTGAVTLDATDCGAAAVGHNHAGVYEYVLGNPSADGMVLSSTVGGTRSWVTPSSGVVPSNLVDSSITISFDTSYIVMDYLIVVSDFIVSGNVGVI
jgi:hypothetical protein